MEMENENARKAQQLLRFYFRRLFDAAKASWDADVAGDIESIVPLLLDALDERIALAAGKASLAGEVLGSTPERVRFGQRNWRLDDIERMTIQSNGGYRVNFASGEKLDLTPHEGAKLWELLNSQAIDLDEVERNKTE